MYSLIPDTEAMFMVQQPAARVKQLVARHAQAQSTHLLDPQVPWQMPVSIANIGLHLTCLVCFEMFRRS